MGFGGHFLFSCIRRVVLSFSRSFLSIYSGSVLDQMNPTSAPLSRRAPPHLLAGMDVHPSTLSRPLHCHSDPRDHLTAPWEGDAGLPDKSMEACGQESQSFRGRGSSWVGGAHGYLLKELAVPRAPEATWDSSFVPR